MASGAFNKGCSLFAQLSGDNSRLKIWDASSSSALHEYSPTGEHAAELTCLSWSSPAASSSSAKSPKKQAKASSLVAVGTAEGHVIIWDTSRGEVKSTLGGASKGHASRVLDVAFGAGGATVYASTDASRLVCWTVATGKEAWSLSVGKQPARKVAAHPGGDRVATGATFIKVWDAGTLASDRKYEGHASGVVTLEYSPCGRFLLSSSGDRFVSMWDASEGGTERAPLQTFTLESSPVALGWGPAEGGGEGMIRFLAVSSAGSMSVWRVEEPEGGGGGRKPLKAQCRVSCEGKGDRIGSALWGGAGGGVWVCRGSEALPFFEEVDVEGEGGGGELAPQVALARREGGLLPAADGKKKKVDKAPGGDERMEDVTGPADMPLNSASAGKRRRLDGGVDAGEADYSEDDAGSLDGEETLEDKVRALGLDGGGGGGGGGVAPKADSVHTLLVQALQSDDRALLEQCLGVTSPQVIQATVAKLHPSAVSSLLAKVVAKFHARPTRGVNLVTWIRAILTQHTGYLMTQPDVVRTLTPLYQLVESRVSTYHQLLKLEGRLELALSQVEGGGGAGRAGGWREPDLTVHDGVDEVVGGEGGGGSSEEDGEGDTDQGEEGEGAGDRMEEDEEEDDDDDDDDDEGDDDE